MKNKGKRVLAAALGLLLAFQSAGQSGFLNNHSGRAYGQTATVDATTLNVRSGPGTGYSLVARLNYGTTVSTIGETTGSDGVLWYQIQYTSGTETRTGYVSSAYLKFPVSYSYDSDFESYLNSQGFPESYKESLRTLHAEHPSWVFQAQHIGLDWNEVIDNESAVGSNLVDSGSISSWKSTAYGAYDWNTGTWTGFDGASWVAASRDIVAYYMDPRNFLNDTYVFQFLLHTYDSASQTREGLQSLVSGTFLEKEAVSAGTGSGSQETGNSGSETSGSVTGPGQDGSASSSGQELTPGQNVGPGYENSSSQIVISPSDPSGQTQPGSTGNQDVSLEGPSLTVSERQTSTVALPNVEYGPGMDASVITGDTTGSVSESPAPSGQSYVDILMNAAAQSGVNPYVLGAMILQEQGNGTSGSISGVTSGYEGYYNFFNIGAYASDGMSPVTRGLWYASQSGSYGRPWDSIEKSIVGGALYYGENFVKQGQDTFYLKKFNVQGNNLYKHQYMTNVEAAAGEGAKLSRAYTDEMKTQALTFKIPVFNNMPETACAKPAIDGSPNNKLSSLSVEGYTLTPTFSMDTESYDVIVNPSVSAVSVSAAAIDSKATVSGTGTVSLQSGTNTISITVTAENGDVRTYQLNVVRQADAPVVSVAPGTGQSGSSVQIIGPGQTDGPGSSSSGSSSSQSGPGAETSASSGLEGAAGVGQPATATRPAGETSGASAVTEAPGTTAATETTAAPETTAPSSQSGSPGSGDCNGDGQVSMLDVMLIRQHVLGQSSLSGSAASAADVNGDGSITSADADALQSRILGS